MLAGATPASFLVGQASVFISIATAMALRMDRSLCPPRTALPHGARSAVVLLFTLILLLEALARGEASVLVPIAQMGFVATAVLGFLFLREPLTARKAAGLAAALAALACLAAS
jgi:transporter family protein